MKGREKFSSLTTVLYKAKREGMKIYLKPGDLPLS
jgi:hypothetical protein